MILQKYVYIKDNQNLLYFLKKHGLGVDFVWTDSSKIALPIFDTSEEIEQSTFYESHLFHHWVAQPSKQLVLCRIDVSIKIIEVSYVRKFNLWIPDMNTTFHDCHTVFNLSSYTSLQWL